MDELNLQELQKSQLSILKKVKTICDENKYTYYLFFGSLIGAIRHKGFIPWDDDIDIVMPRDDYEKFIDYCIKHKEELKPYGIVHYRTRKKYLIAIAKFENSDYKIIDIDGNECCYGVNIDIYPLDGVGNERKNIVNASNNMGRWVKYSNVVKKAEKSKKNGFKRFVGKCINIMANTFKWVLIRYLDNKAKKKRINDCKYIGIPCWQADEGSYFDKDLLGERYEKFEDDYYRIPEGYDTILKQIYGNYMELPPVEKRGARHLTKAYRR